MPSFRSRPTLCAAIALAWLVVGSACRRTEAEYQKLVSENAYLRAEVERLSRRGLEEKAEEKEGHTVGKPDLEATIVDLWGQRFDDNEFRARQRLSGKMIRLTGSVDGVSAESVTLAGESKRFGNVRITAYLSPGYAARIRDGLAALERGTVATVQGKLTYERMILIDAMFVEQVSGRTLYSDDLLALAAGTPIGGVMKPAITAPASGSRKATPAPK